MIEHWKGLIYHGIDYSKYYKVSNKGEIKGLKTGKIRKKNVNHEGYYFVSISTGSRSDKATIKVHRAVAENFVDGYVNGFVINHKDGNKLNNDVENLEWCTIRQNVVHAYETGLTKYGYDRRNAKLTQDDVRYIKQVYEKGNKSCNAVALGLKYGVGEKTIRDIIMRRTYRSVA